MLYLISEPTEISGMIEIIKLWAESNAEFCSPLLSFCSPPALDQMFHRQHLWVRHLRKSQGLNYPKL